MTFDADEVAYLRSQLLARLATRSADGQPDVVPVAYEFDGECFWIGGSGDSVLRTRKVRNVVAGNVEVALVIDDMMSFDPFIARGIRVYGRAEPPIPREGNGRPRPLPANHSYGVVELEHGGRTGGRHVVPGATD